MDSGDLNNWAGIGGFLLTLGTAGAGYVGFRRQKARERASEEQHDRHRREDMEQFDRQIREAKEASAAHIEVLKEQNDILRRAIDADTTRALQATEELLEVSLARIQLHSGGSDILVAEIANCAPVTAEVRNIELVNDMGGLRPCWATLKTATEGSGLPDGMAIANPVSFRIHKDQTVTAYFAKRMPGRTEILFRDRWWHQTTTPRAIFDMRSRTPVRSSSTP